MSYYNRAFWGVAEYIAGLGSFAGGITYAAMAAEQQHIEAATDALITGGIIGGLLVGHAVSRGRSIEAPHAHDLDPEQFLQ